MALSHPNELRFSKLDNIAGPKGDLTRNLNSGPCEGNYYLTNASKTD